MYRENSSAFQSGSPIPRSQRHGTNTRSHLRTRYDLEQEPTHGAGTLVARGLLSSAVEPPHLYRRPLAIDDLEMVDLSAAASAGRSYLTPVLSAEGRKKQRQMFVVMMLVTPPFPFLTFAALQGLFDWLFLWWTGGETSAFTR
jgi:hypothetical protein